MLMVYIKAWFAADLNNICDGWGWPFSSSILAPWRKSLCYSHFSTFGWRKLPNLGKINEDSIDCQKQVRAYWLKITLRSVMSVSLLNQSSCNLITVVHLIVDGILYMYYVDMQKNCMRLHWSLIGHIYTTHFLFKAYAFNVKYTHAWCINPGTDMHRGKGGPLRPLPPPKKKNEDWIVRIVCEE